MNFPFICSNTLAASAYGVYISQLIRYCRACGSYQDFLDRGLLLTRKLLNQGFLLVKLKPSLRKFYGRHVLCSFELNIDAGKYFKKNTHSYLYYLFFLIWQIIIGLSVYYVTVNLTLIQGKYLRPSMRDDCETSSRFKKNIVNHLVSDIVLARTHYIRKVWRCQKE